MVNQYARRRDMAGGTRHDELATLLKDHGWQTTIFATPPEDFLNRRLSPLTPVSNAIEDGVSFAWLYAIPYQSNNWRRYTSMASFFVVSMLAGILRRAKAPDVVIGSSPHLLAPLSAWIVAKWYRVPFVLEVRDLWPESLVQLGLKNRPVVWGLSLIERFLYKKSDLIIALTEGIESGIRRKQVEQPAIVLIPNASLRPEPLNASKRQCTRDALGWSGKTVAIWIGAHGHANGLEVVIDAARICAGHTDILFVLFGEGSEKSRLVDLAHGMPNVRFYDPVPKREVDDYLRAADIGLLVHRDTEAVKGARPNKLFDYMTAALPIVVSMDGEARRLIEEPGAGVFIRPEQPQELALAILEMHRSADRRVEQGLNGYAWVAETQSRENSARLLSESLTELVEH
jgi:glycosyltransferase involved in cell wall biosynthesis